MNNSLKMILISNVILFANGYNIMNKIIAKDSFIKTNIKLSSTGSENFIYGTTWNGGNSGCDNYFGHGCGTIYKLDTTTGLVTTLYKFSWGDGANPNPSLVTMGNDGFLYGTTWEGGNSGCDNMLRHGCGTIFKFNPTTGALTTLFKFYHGIGTNPNASLTTIGNDGFLYGTTREGGISGCDTKYSHGCGTIFKINPTTGELSTFYAFSKGDGAYPNSTLTTLGNDGFLYGTTWEGGNSGCDTSLTHGCGTIFRINPTTRAFTTLYRFSKGDGSNPNASLARVGNDGFLYGTTWEGGNNGCNIIYSFGCGTIFRINPTTGALTTLYKFSWGDGANPNSSLTTIGSDGFLYGTTWEGGNSGCDINISHGCGTIFRINPTTGALSTLYRFSWGDGANPNSLLTTIGEDGFLYGTTWEGGNSGCDSQFGHGCGTIFKIDPTTVELTTLYRFSKGDGANPNTSLSTTGVIDINY